MTLAFLVATCFTLVSPQLALVQHTALMDLYDALGSNKPSQIEKNRFSHLSLQVALLHCVRALWRLHRALAVL